MPTSEEVMARARQLQQRGDLPQAERLYRQVVDAEPSNASVLFLLGAACHQQQRAREAANYYRRALALKPDMAEAHHNLGVALAQDGKMAEAVACYHQALRLNPNYFEAHNSLGVALASQGKAREAVSCYQQAVRLKPDYVEAYTNLASLLMAQGHLPEAAACLQEMLRFKPDLATAHFQLGNVRHAQQLPEKASEHFQRTVQLQPDNALAFYNLGNALQIQGRFVEAEGAYRRALQLRPAYAEAYNNMGSALANQGRLDEALECYRQSLALKDNYPEAYYNRGNALKEQGQVAPAIASYREALRLRPNYPYAHNNLGDSFLDQGEVARAAEHYREALRLKPDYAQAIYNLAQLVVQAPSIAEDGLAERIVPLLAARTSPADASLLHFALADLLRRQKRHNEAFEQYQQANALRQRLYQEAGTAFDPNEHTRRVDQLIALFTRAFIRQARGLGTNSELAVFIVGMPRSGTTLVEQILCGHPCVFGAGELTDIGRLVAGLPGQPWTETGYPNCLSTWSARGGRQPPAVSRQLAVTYLNRLTELGGAAARVTDKLPENYIHLGFIALLFPRARIIHCRRDPLDVCLSCYFQNFKGMNFACDLHNLGHYYRQYQRLMEHWKAALSVRICEVVYEELVADPETVSRRLIAFCGLDWDEGCLAFQSNPRAVQTASKLQVRQPIYTSSLARWRPYAAHLGRLREALCFSEASENEP
jgi:tetratricopeptide (TPR) repeat protein